MPKIRKKFTPLSCIKYISHWELPNAFSNNFLISTIFKPTYQLSSNLIPGLPHKHISGCALKNVHNGLNENPICNFYHECQAVNILSVSTIGTCYKQLPGVLKKVCLKYLGVSDGFLLDKSCRLIITVNVGKSTFFEHLQYSGYFFDR